MAVQRRSMHQAAVALVGQEFAASELLAPLQRLPIHAGNESVAHRYYGNVGRFEVWRSDRGVFRVWTSEQDHDQCHTPDLPTEQDALAAAYRLLDTEKRKPVTRRTKADEQVEAAEIAALEAEKAAYALATAYQTAAPPTAKRRKRRIVTADDEP